MNCPVCNSKMTKKGNVGTADNGLPDSSHLSRLEIASIPYYECERCKVNEIEHFAYQRTLVNGKWYYFNYAKWNFLKEEIFNPSRRME